MTPEEAAIDAARATKDAVRAAKAARASAKAMAVVLRTARDAAAHDMALAEETAEEAALLHEHARTDPRISDIAANTDYIVKILDEFAKSSAETLKTADLLANNIDYMDNTAAGIARIVKARENAIRFAGRKGL